MTYPATPVIKGLLRLSIDLFLGTIQLVMLAAIVSVMLLMGGWQWFEENYVERD